MPVSTDTLQNATTAGDSGVFSLKWWQESLLVQPHPKDKMEG